jgi:hypothetical protein
MPKRTVYCEDALTWLQNHDQNTNYSKYSFVASMPDISEFPKFSVSEWKTWFFDTASLILSRTPDEGVTIFYQSDIKLDGEWIDKGYLCQKAAEAQHSALLWHKIICRTTPGIATFGRPAYAHLLCFSKNLRLSDLSKSTADVIPDLGEKTWERGMGLSTCLAIAKFIQDNTDSTTLINPFCGEGSMLAAANSLGLDAIGIERSPKRAEKSRQLTLTPDHKNWMHNNFK